MEASSDLSLEFQRAGSTPVARDRSWLPPRRSVVRLLLRWGIFTAIALVNAAVVVLVVGYYHYARGLPEIPSIDRYRPPIISEMISADGQIETGDFVADISRIRSLPVGCLMIHSAMIQP